MAPKTMRAGPQCGIDIWRRHSILGYGRARPRARFAVICGLLLLGCGCAASPSGGTAADEADSDNDPAEGVNRAVFKANLAVDHAAVKPVAQAYTDHVPEVVQTGVHN